LKHLLEIITCNGKESVLELLDEKIEEAWASYLKTITRAGYGLLLYSTNDVPLLPRNAPPLRFDSFAKARKFVDAVITTGKFPPGKQQSLKEQKDPYEYTFYLVYALLYANLGKWHFSKMLAAHSVDLAGKPGQNRITGREAYFLLSVASRHDSREASVLEDAQTYLNIAIKLGSDEGHHNRSRDVRFESEQVALHLTYHLYAAFCDQEIPEDIPSLELLQKSAIDQLGQVEEEKDEVISAASERNLLTNLFMIVFLRAFKFNEAEAIDKVALRRWLTVFEKNVDESGPIKPKLSYLVNVLYRMAVWFLSEDDRKKEKKRMRKSAMELLEQLSREICVMPYDRKRFDFLKNCMEDAEV
jgi:hypothetical protein